MVGLIEAIALTLPGSMVTPSPRRLQIVALQWCCG
jgi:hypothetical protein